MTDFDKRTFTRALTAADFEAYGEQLLAEAAQPPRPPTVILPIAWYQKLVKTLKAGEDAELGGIPLRLGDGDRLHYDLDKLDRLRQHTTQ